MSAAATTARLLAVAAYATLSEQQIRALAHEWHCTPVTIRRVWRDVLEAREYAGQRELIATGT